MIIPHVLVMMAVSWAAGASRRGGVIRHLNLAGNASVGRTDRPWPVSLSTSAEDGRDDWDPVL